MSIQIWSAILTAVGLAGFFLAGKKIWWAWYVNIANQAIWLVYAIATEQWPFLVGVVAYTFVFTKNAIEWTKDHRDPYRNFDLNHYAWPAEIQPDFDIVEDDYKVKGHKAEEELPYQHLPQVIPDEVPEDGIFRQTFEIERSELVRMNNEYFIYDNFINPWVGDLQCHFELEMGYNGPRVTIYEESNALYLDAKYRFTVEVKALKKKEYKGAESGDNLSHVRYLSTGEKLCETDLKDDFVTTGDYKLQSCPNCSERLQELTRREGLM